MKYHTTRKPQGSSTQELTLDSSEEAFLKKTVKELNISNEWLEESKFFYAIRLDSPSTSIRCQMHETSFDALYNPIVGVNIMSESFACALFENISLNPTTKFLKKSLRAVSLKLNFDQSNVFSLVSSTKNVYSYFGSRVDIVSYIRASTIFGF
jgi:hypothetical protein